MLQTGQKTVTTAGTRVALGDVVVNSSLAIKALAANTGVIYLGDSTVSSTNGFQLAAGEIMLIQQAGNLKDIYIDASANSQGVSWMAYSGV
jgi:hypothetical protein